jgi:hypothetical protein
MDLGFLGGMSGVLYGWLSSGIFWAIAIIASGAAILAGLYFRKKRMMIYEVLELGTVDKTIKSFTFTRGGWFRKRFTFMDLWDYGTESMFRLADMTPVMDVTQDDYKIINGRKGLIVMRDPLDPKFAFPISNVSLDRKSKELMAEIASSDLRDAAVLAIDQADQEMQGKWQKIAPYVIGAIVILGSVFIIIFITQYGKHMVDKSSETLRYITDVLHGAGNTLSASPSASAP